MFNIKDLYIGKLNIITKSLLVCSGLGSITTPVIAKQVEDQIEEAVALEVISVTATKRVQRFQDIPFAISSMSEGQLEKSGINNLEEFAYLVPGLSIASQGNGKTQINIRGINSGEVGQDNTRAHPTVSMYLDEMPLSSALLTPNIEAYDIERVEVLRGPQGTLYGSGSLTGAIRFITKKPVMDEFEAKIDLAASSVSHGGNGGDLKGVFNIPLIDNTLAVRAVAYRMNEAGWLD